MACAAASAPFFDGGVDRASASKLIARHYLASETDFVQTRQHEQGTRRFVREAHREDRFVSLPGGVERVEATDGIEGEQRAQRRPRGRRVAFLLALAVDDDRARAVGHHRVQEVGRVADAGVQEVSQLAVSAQRVARGSGARPGQRAATTRRLPLAGRPRIGRLGRAGGNRCRR